MGYEPGEIKTFNPNKEIAKEITLEILIRHRDALKQARTGELPGIPMDKISDNDRKINQVRALNLIISAQREMITISRPIIFFGAMQKWKKKYSEEEKQKQNPFEQDENDYNKLLCWLGVLRYCAEIIISADKSKSVDDDFMISRIAADGEEHNELTNNFFEMLEDLESSYEQIYLLMLTNKIVSAGIGEDEEMTYKEKEAEAIRRVVDA